MPPISLGSLPEGFPHHIPTPQFKIGDRVQWQPAPTQDFGTITGLQYAPTDQQDWAWKYTVCLDHQSPSSKWVTIDTAWEIDLEIHSTQFQSSMGD